MAELRAFVEENKTDLIIYYIPCRWLQTLLHPTIDNRQPTRANFFFGPTSDLENFSRLVNLPFLFVLRKVTLLRGLVNLGDKTLESTQLGSSRFFSSDVAKSRSELYRQLVLLQ